MSNNDNRNKIYSKFTKGHFFRHPLYRMVPSLSYCNLLLFNWGSPDHSIKQTKNKIWIQTSDYIHYENKFVLAQPIHLQRGWPAVAGGRCEKSEGLVISDKVCWQHCGTWTFGQNVQEFCFPWEEIFCYFKEDDWTGICHHTDEQLFSFMYCLEQMF